MLHGGVGGKNEVVGLNYSSGNLGGWVNEELQLGILAINRQIYFTSGEVNIEPVPPPKLWENKKI